MLGGKSDINQEGQETLTACCAVCSDLTSSFYLFSFINSAFLMAKR